MSSSVTSSRWWLVGLESFTAVGAVVGTVGLLVDGEAFMGRTVTAEDLPFHSWVVAAVALVCCNLLVPLAAIGAELRHHSAATRLHLAAGVVMVVWIVVQVAVIGLVFVLQPLMLVVGCVIAVMAWRRGGGVFSGVAGTR